MVVVGGVLPIVICLVSERMVVLVIVIDVVALVVTVIVLLVAIVVFVPLAVVIAAAAPCAVAAVPRCARVVGVKMRPAAATRRVRVVPPMPRVSRALPLGGLRGGAAR